MRQRLLDAAQKLFARKGLDKSSVEESAAAVGYTPGAFYSNFNANGNDSSSCCGAMPRACTSDIYASLYRDSKGFMAWTEARLLIAAMPDSAPSSTRS
jgi:AcrR family transcriptional regulator